MWLLILLFVSSKCSPGYAEEICLVKYDTNSTLVKLGVSEGLRGEPGRSGKRGPIGPPGPAGPGESDTVLRQRYDAKIAALEARLNALSDPEWYLASNGFRYRILNRPTDFFDARDQCTSAGGKLATVGMRNKKVKTKILEFLFTDAYNPGLWIGLTDIVEHDNWVWLDGITADEDATDWDDHEPNNYGGREHCSEISYGRGGTYNDVPCSSNLYYPLCERGV